MKKSYYWIIGILLFLIITNPSYKAFKDYLGDRGHIHSRKKANFFVCSIYDYDGNTFLAAVGNFFQLNNSQIIMPTDDNFLTLPPDTSAVPVYPKDTVRMKK